jgi:hypothetical protein
LINDLGPNYVYVSFKGEDEDSLESQIYHWFKPTGHWIPYQKLIWSDAPRGIDRKLLGKWYSVVRNTKGFIWDYEDYDPDVVLMFKLTWGGA